MKKRKCPVCGEIMQGRKDKVYCSLKCKSTFHYEKAREQEQFYFEVDAQLKTNRKILKQFNKTGKTTLRREVLHKLGFNPNYFTHYWKSKNGDVYLFVYDYGFLKLEEKHGDEVKNKYLIVQWQAYMNREVTAI